MARPMAQLLMGALPIGKPMGTPMGMPMRMLMTSPYTDHFNGLLGDRVTVLLMLKLWTIAQLKSHYRAYCCM